MVTARYLGNKFVEPLIEKRREEGQAQERRRWIEWNRRRLEAEASGVPFDEPPPQGNRILNLLRDNSEQVVTVPACPFAFALNRSFAGIVLLEQVERHVSDERQIPGGVAGPDPALILPE